MGQRTGSADLPLHGGRVPAWLGQRMARLGRLIVEAIILHYGRDELLRRLAHPFWFQSFGAVMGMDWHSSGITTSVVGALKRGLAGQAPELGLSVCGGRGRASRRTPRELLAVSERTGLDGVLLAETSKLVAKVDNTAVQDGFQLYLHAFFLGDDGAWAVVQQGMAKDRGQARRYHWLSLGLESFVEEPHRGIEGEPKKDVILNLTDRRAAKARETLVRLVEGGPDPLLRELARLGRAPSTAAEPVLFMPAHHELRPSDVLLPRLRAGLVAAAERGPRDFAELLRVPGVGPRTVEALALIGEVVHGAPCRFRDPARFSFALGGKDGHPFPVPLRVYDATLGVLKAAVESAKLGNEDRLAAIRALDREARRLEGVAEGLSFSEIVERERQRSEGYGGRTVFGPAPSLTSPPFRGQLELGLVGVRGRKLAVDPGA